MRRQLTSHFQVDDFRFCCTVIDFELFCWSRAVGMNVVFCTIAHLQKEQRVHKGARVTLLLHDLHIPRFPMSGVI